MSLSDIYSAHHATSRDEGFSILEKERGRLIAELIGEGKTVLDIGCRNGVLTKFFIKGNTVTGVDIDPVALEVAHKNLGIETFHMDLLGEWEELRERTFDVIVCGEVLEHLYFPAKVTEKVARHLNTGGMFIGSVPNAFSLRNRLRYLLGQKKNTPLEDPTHITQFHINELRVMLQKNFDSVEVRGLSRFQKLADMHPGFFAFDLFFIAKKK
jgi:2-polyprenyl-3-methyl-5-hydroxy-6-metoxy-1,4-benzoquinol methylase